MTNSLKEPGLPSILNRLGKMTTIRDTYLVEQSLLHTLGPLLGVPRSSLYRVNPQGEVIRALHYARSVTQDGEGIRRVAESMEEVSPGEEMASILSDLFDSVRMLGKPCRRPTEDKLTICYPLLGGDELCGYFVFERNYEETPFESAMIVGVLEVFTNYYALLDTSQRDRLTGLLNRYSLELNLDRLWNLLTTRLHGAEAVDEKQVQPTTDARHASDMQNYWFGLIDIDYFKQINDSYGHMIGDEVLIMVTRLLEKSFRSADLLYRYGGEEFVAIIAADDLDSAYRVFERARRKVESFQFPQIGHVTISAGFAEADASVLPQEILNRADRALYEAKRTRNDVRHYGTLVKQGVLQQVATGSIDLWP